MDAVGSTLLIEQVSKRMKKEGKYICITRPRRFGKTINARMLAAYYTKGLDSGALFEQSLEFRDEILSAMVVFVM